MSRETLKDFLNSIGKPGDRIGLSYDNDNVKLESGVDLGKDSTTGEDLLNLDNENIGLLGDYLSYIIENSSNIFKIDSGNERATASKRGESLVLAEEQGASNVFVNQGTEYSNDLNSYSNSGKFENLNDLIDKTGKESNAHFMLNDIQGGPLSDTNNTNVNMIGDENQIVQEVNKILFKHNRFANIANKNVFHNRDSGIESIDLEKSLKFEDKFGKHNIENNTIDLNQLKNIGESLMLKASGFDTGLSPSTSQSPDDLFNAIKTNNESIKSSFFSEEGYVKKEKNVTRSKNAFGAPENTAGESLRDGKGAYEKIDNQAKGAKEFGVIYNSAFRFNSSNSQFHKTQAAIACRILSLISKNFIDSIADIVKINDLNVLNKNIASENSYDKSSGPYPKGTYNKIASFDLDLLKKLVFVKTTHTYPECFEKGIEIFFGNNIDEIDKIKKNTLFAQNPGYWLSIASSILKSSTQIFENISQINEIEGDFKSKIITIVNILQQSKIIKFANAAATTGDIYFKSNNRLKEGISQKKPFDVDSIESNNSTMISKSKDKSGRLVWRQSSATSAYLLPRNIIRAGIKLNNLVRGAYPARGMLGSELIESTYLDRKHDGSYNRIPEDVIKNLEDKLEGEYVPFYIQDLRTNEIISFHAFLTQLSDTISPSFTDTPGYGRLDSIKTYSGTKRTVQVAFTLYATSKQDYDLMWYKINKLTTLLYPQWTQGTKVSSFGAGDSFVQPFSQVLGASPIVRLRIGDVIKSNYSKFSLARLFGIGDPDINPIAGDIPGPGFRGAAENVLNIAQNLALESFYALYGSPLQYIPQKSGLSGLNGVVAKAANVGLKYLRESLSSTLSNKNGFANPFAVDAIIKKLKEPDDFFDESLGYQVGENIKIKPNMVKGYLCDDDGNIYYIDKMINGQIIERNFNNDKLIYKILVIDYTEGSNLLGKKIFLSHNNILPDYKDIFLNLGGNAPSVDISGINVGNSPLFQYIEPRSFFDSYLQNIENFSGISETNAQLDLADGIPFLSPESERFMLAENNPFVKAYESTMGRGLAGTIGSISFNWLEDAFTWETDYNSRAPKGVTISFSFDVIHDIAPGLDHSGYNRAPIYNVGDIMKEISGDPHNDTLSSEYNFKKNKVNFKTGE